MIAGHSNQDFKALIFKFHKGSIASAIASGSNEAKLEDSQNAPSAMAIVVITQRSIGLVIKSDSRHSITTSIAPRSNIAM